LTDDELDKINKEHPGFLRDEDVLKYGSDPKKQFSYICPRYWCLKNNTIVDPKDLTEVIVNGKVVQANIYFPVVNQSAKFYFFKVPGASKNSKMKFFFYRYHSSLQNLSYEVLKNLHF
jgi:hypothetical protein